jgi:hypothetical protein
MKLPELNIPDGLEQAFFNVVQFLGGKSGDVYIAHKTKPAKKYYSHIAFRSLFVKWKDLYNNFNEIRKNKWTTYWLTLPFGGHWGAGGYPGSGYSAFVYVNAPRYQDGLALLLDPPELLGEELILNSGFDGNADGWYFEPSDDILYYEDFCMKLNITDGETEGLFTQNNYFALNVGKFVIACDLNISENVNDGFFRFGIRDNYDWIAYNIISIDQFILDNEWHKYEFIYNTDWIEGAVDVKFRLSFDFVAPSGSVFFDNFSVRQVLD